MSKVMSITGALAAVVLAAAPVAIAQVPTARDSVKAPWDPGRMRGSTDTAYIHQAILGNSLEAQLGRIAETRAKDSGVKDFAKRMISEHTSMNERWGAVAKKNNVSTQVDFHSDQKQTIDRLQGLSGSAFDQAYMDEMIREHDQALSVFQQIASSASSPEVRQLASTDVPVIREHLTLAQQVGSRVGVSTTASTGGVSVPTTSPTTTTPTPSPSDTFQRPDTSLRRTTADRATQNARENRNDRNARGTLRAADRDFVQDALQDHLMHIRLAERAQREAKSDETRRLAKQIEADFKQWQGRWELVASQYGMKTPKGLGRLHEDKVQRLEHASRGNVDHTYAAIVADHLASVVPYFEKEGQAVQSDPVRRLVNAELPVIRGYLARARRLEGQPSARADNSDRKREKDSDGK